MKPVGLAVVKHVETLPSWPTLPVKFNFGTSNQQRLKTGA
jgi:hypothetical protein